MPYGWVAAAAVVGGGIQADAATNAANTQAQGGRAAMAQQLAMFNTLNQQSAPYRQAGTSALADLVQRLGDQPAATPTPSTSTAIGTDGQPVQIIPWEQASALSQSATTPFVTQDPSGQLVQFNGNPDAPSFTPFAGAPAQTPAPQFNVDPNAPGLLHAFDATDLGTNLSPSYNFMLQQGLGQTQNALNAGGGNISGNTMRGMTQFAENYASTGYQQAFENYTANQTNIFNRLADIAGLGQTANQTTAGAGTALGVGAANSLANAAAAQAGGTVGSANAIAGGLTNAASWYAAPTMINSLKGTPTTSVGTDPSLGVG